MRKKNPMIAGATAIAVVCAVSALVVFDLGSPDGDLAAAASEPVEQPRTVPLQQWYELTEDAEAAFEAGRLDEATRFAQQLLEGARGREDNWNYGNAIHDGNILLGRIALRAGNVQEAKAHLIEAGKTDGSPQLNSFGPDLTLAQELLERGERQAVAEYLRLCARFWKGYHQRLHSWAAQIEAGGEPSLDKPISPDPRDDRQGEEQEIVMDPGDRITARTPVGAISIVAGENFERSYTWEGATRSVRMIPRSERWYGSFGIYYPGPGEHWQEHNGITRGVLDEGQQHFQNVDEAMEWLAARDWMPFVWTEDGLVVGWRKVPQRRQLNVEVWQIYVNREKLTLPESQDDAVHVERAR